MADGLSIEERVRAILVALLGVTEERLTDDATLSDDLGADSLDLVELTMNLEQEFDLEEITDEDAEKLCTVGDVVAFVRLRVGEAGIP